MVWDKCKIVLHSSSKGFFYTNDIVTGTIILEVKQNRKFGHIDLNVKGTSKAMWSRPSPTMPFIKIYSEKKKIFSVVIDVFGDLKGTTIQPGIISRQFHFYLPSDLPPSYDDSLAKICYRIKIHIKNTLGLSKTISLPFTVVNHVNLNHLDEYKIPMLYEMTKKFGKSSHFSLIFKTYKGFTSRQLLQFEAIITNVSKIRVKKIKVFLIKKINYNIIAGHNSAEKILCKSVYKHVPNLVTQSCYFNMEIPQVSPSTSNLNFAMITISYLLRVKVNFLFHLPLEIDIPVRVASVPINYHNNNIN